MKIKIVKFLNKLYHKVLSFLPSKLPTGLPGAPSFEQWVSSIITAYGFPDNSSMRFAIAVSVLHAENEVKTLSQFLLGFPATRSKRYFALKLMKGAANQIAAAEMERLKTEQQELAKKEQEAATGIESTNQSGAV